MLRTVNRVVLGVLGLALVVLGGAVLVAGLDLQRRWHVDLGSWWPFDGRHDVLLSRADRTRWRHEDWWWPAVLGGLGLVVLLAAWWALAQLRRRRLREVRVDTGDGESATLRARSLEAVVAAEAELLAGVDRAHVRLGGRRTAPEARVGLLLEAHAEPAAALRRLRAEALEHARASAGLARLPTEVRMRAVRHRAERVT
ncbi:alkaline shock response membrane anchor protein AmaP [Streptomyces sp. B1866]|uniref:alkaline shock response membrane anchor protein AmaP n=1 Tax=Streptomyces sp. B1866 TaxID=3075431 RepID=UPI002890B633|nr:alkaline shock response membrane anchor protein AmaP [Streptomyces sp. B1866]MDT3400778.1 alkaline shock response membrane anchor protein AmaP [Streptomyces sp. B1866]